MYIEDLDLSKNYGAIQHSIKSGPVTHVEHPSCLYYSLSLDGGISRREDVLKLGGAGIFQKGITWFIYSFSVCLQTLVLVAPVSFVTHMFGLFVMWHQHWLCTSRRPPLVHSTCCCISRFPGGNINSRSPSPRNQRVRLDRCDGFLELDPDRISRWSVEFFLALLRSFSHRTKPDAKGAR